MAALNSRASRNWSRLLSVLVTSCTLALCKGFSGVQTGLTVRDFKNITSIQELECWGGSLDPEMKLLSLHMYRVWDLTPLAYVNPLINSCIVYNGFSSCVIDASDTRKSRLRVLVVDLAEEEKKQYGCNITSFKQGGPTTTLTWLIFVKMQKTTTTTVSTTTSTTTTTQPPASRNVNGRPVASGVQGELHDFYLPPVVLVIGLILIIVLALLSLVLIVLQCHKAGRRKKRNRAANRESLLSAKSEIAGCSTGSKDLDLGVTTYRATRSFPSFAPGPQQGPMPVGPPAHFAMRYQKGPPDDTGYVSGSSNHYSEPYGCHEDGTQDRTRPTSRPGLPQVKGSPQPPRLPDNHP